MHPHAKIISRFDGKAELARALGLPLTRLSKWHTRGIPARYWPMVEQAAAERGMIVTARDIMHSMTSDPPEHSQETT